MTFAEKLTSAFQQAESRPGALVYAYKPAGPTGKARHGAYDPFGLDEDGDPKLVIAAKKIQGRLAQMGYFPASKPAAKPAGVKAAAEAEESKPKRTRKKKEDEQPEI